MPLGVESEVLIMDELNNNVVTNEQENQTPANEEVKTYTQEEVLAMLAQVQNQKGEEK